MVVIYRVGKDHWVLFKIVFSSMGNRCRDSDEREREREPTHGWFFKSPLG